ncbi:MAG: hypothetical protein FWD49_06690 [Firmicutes bacterium]|nr:hypothetical protein [Bacillota bacterium]
MLLKNVINRTIQILGLEDEVNISTPSRKLDKLADCANMVYNELTLQYIHLKSKEILNFSGGRAYYTDFTHRVREILSVKARGSEIKFTMYPLFVEAGISGTAEVSYVYHLGELSLEDALIIPPQYTEYILATGVVAEYYYRTGLTDEALFYRQRYDTAITNLSKRAGSVNLPRRRFV